MNWDAIGAIAETLGAVGVIASLFYLASQIRRSSESTEAATVLAVSQATQDRLMGIAQTPELAEAMRKSLSGEELSGAESVQVSFFNRASVRGIENTFTQHRRGLLSTEEWQAYEALLHLNIHGPVFETWWAREAGTFSAEFRALIDRLSVRPPAI